MIYQFGDCELDSARFELHRGGRAEPVEPQVFELLLYLIQNRDRVVTRAELNQAVWNGRIVTDSALNSRIKAARSAIGDDGKTQSRIRTVQRTGYRFVGTVSDGSAPVSIAAAPASTADPASIEAPLTDPRAAHADIASAAPGTNRRLRVALGALTVAGLLILVGLGGWSIGGRFVSKAPGEVVQLSIPDVGPPNQLPFGVRHVAISADGARVAYASQTRLWIRRMSEPRAVAVDTSGPMNPFFSPNGEWVGFFELTGLVKVPSAGGTPVLLAATSERPAGAFWGTDGTIVFATTNGLYRVADQGGEPQLIARPNPERNERLYAWPTLLPDEQTVLFTVFPQDAADAERIVHLDLRSGESRIVLTGGVAAQYVPTGHLIYTAGETLYAIRFDRAARATRGAPIALSGISASVTRYNSAAQFAVADNGTLVFLAPRPRDENHRRLSWVDRRGVREPLALEPGLYADPCISPDGTLVALDIGGANRDIWILDLQRQNLTRQTTAPTEDVLPMWSHDSQRVFFASDRAGTFDIYSQAIDGPAEARVEFVGPGFQVPNALTPDGGRLIVYENYHDVSVLNLAESTLEPLLHSEFQHRITQLSPDGNWIAYESDESGQQDEIFVRPFPDVGARREKVSINGGRYPKWGPPGSGELYYVDLDGGMMAAAVELTPHLRLGGVTKLFDTRKPPKQVTGRPYDVSPLDGRFLLIEPIAQAPETVTNISVVLNWFEELRTQAP